MTEEDRLSEAIEAEKKKRAEEKKYPNVGARRWSLEDQKWVWD